jgi:hypothetical protein
MSLAREQMRRAAWRLHDFEDARGLKAIREWYYGDGVPYAVQPWDMYASILMSEAHRPAGHNGDGRP